MPRHAQTKATARYRPTAQSVLLGLVFSITLAISLFAAGFAVDCLPGTTGTLSHLFSDFNTSVYTPADTTKLAIATRDFTVKPHAKGEAAATQKLAEAIVEAAVNSSSPDSIKHQQWRTIKLSTSINATEQMYELASMGSQYALGPSEISHLIDCNKLMRIAVPILIVIAVIAVFSGVVLGVTSGKKALGHALVVAPFVLICALLGILVWACVDFNAFFSTFHSIFFPQGNWTFPADSLLICMLPTAFWVGMVVLWAFVSIGLSILSVFIGRKLSRTYN